MGDVTSENNGGVGDRAERSEESQLKGRCTLSYNGQMSDKIKCFCYVFRYRNKIYRNLGKETDCRGALFESRKATALRTSQISAERQ